MRRMHVRPLLPAAQVRGRPASARRSPTQPQRDRLPAMLRALAAVLRARLVPAALLAIVLALVQTGALTHLIGHAAAAPQAQTSVPLQADGDGGGNDLPGYCVECIALGGLDLPLAGSACTPQPAARSDHRPDFLAAARALVVPLSPRCRAPPTRA